MVNIINHWVMLIKSTMRYQLTKMKMANKDMEKNDDEDIDKGALFYNVVRNVNYWNSYNTQHTFS